MKFLFKVWKVLNTSERSKMGNTLFNCSPITTYHVRVKGTKFPSKMASNSYLHSKRYNPGKYLYVLSNGDVWNGFGQNASEIIP